MIKDISFISKYKAELIEPLNNMAIISIAEPLERVNLSKEWCYKISLRFHDANAQNPLEPDEFGYIYDQVQLFSRDDASSIINFYENLPATVDTLFAHCSAGISRSAGVVKALCEIYKITDKYDNYKFHNKLVYNTILTTSQAKSLE